MEHDGEPRQAPDDLIQDVEAQRRGNELPLLIAGALSGSELVSAVAGADGDGQGITAGAGDELLHLFRTGVMGVFGRHIDLVLHACQSAQLGLHHYAVVVGILHHLLGDLDVLLKGLGGGIDHHGGETAVHAGLAQLEAVAVVQVQADRQAGLSDGGLYQLDQIGMVSIGPSTLGDLEDQGGVDLFGRLGDPLDDLHVVDIERADSVSAVIGLFEHFSGRYQWHNDHLLLQIYMLYCTISNCEIQ